MAERRFSPDVLDVVRNGKSLRVRAGDGKHRFVGIWMVVVGDRVFVRSWSLKPGGWYRTFVEKPSGRIQVGKCEIPVRAIRTRSERMKSAVDRAYLKKYGTGWELKYAEDLVSAKSRSATIELVPLPSGRLE
ncbi:MAG TPA: DUF2255 family protein [Bryobacteraceae bacterium]|nr:DUF2255 family protein [Bryobacteraceae bacterium]